jgi:Tfp pilus assembly protein PilO
MSRDRLITMATLGGLVLAFLAAVQLPGRRAEATLRGEIATAQAEIARGPQALEHFRTARQELSRRKTYLEGSEASVGPPHDLLARISRVADSAGLSVVRLEPVAVRERASYSEHPFRLDFRGSLSSLTDFLRGIEEEARLFAVEDLDIRKPANGGSGASLEGTLLFTAFAVRAGQAGFAEQDGSPAAP